MSSVNLTIEELEELLDRAAARGARRAIQEIGLHDGTAVKDIEELRSLLGSWRETRKAVWQTVVKIVTTGILIVISTAVWMHFKSEAGK